MLRSRCLLLFQMQFVPHADIPEAVAPVDDSVEIMQALFAPFLETALANHIERHLSCCIDGNIPDMQSSIASISVSTCINLQTGPFQTHSVQK